MIDQKSSLVNPILSKSGSHESVLDQLLVEKPVGLTPPSFNHTFPVESESHTTQVLLVSSVSNKMDGNPPIPEVHDTIYPVPLDQEGNSHVPTTPPASSLVTSFD